MTETRIEPIHPSPLEKKTNTPPRYPVPAIGYASPSSSRLTSLAQGTSASDEPRQRRTCLELLNNLEPAAGARHDDANMAAIDR
jgi:hypothetical protein